MVNSYFHEGVMSNNDLSKYRNFKIVFDCTLH